MNTIVTEAILRYKTEDFGRRKSHMPTYNAQVLGSIRKHYWCISQLYNTTPLHAPFARLSLTQSTVRKAMISERNGTAQSKDTHLICSHHSDLSSGVEDYSRGQEELADLDAVERGGGVRPDSEPLYR